MAQCLPDEADEFPGRGDHDFVAVHPTRLQPAKAAVQAVLRFSARLDHRARLTALPT